MGPAYRKLQVMAWGVALLSWVYAGIGHSWALPVAETGSEALISAEIDGARLLPSPEASVHAGTRFRGATLALGSTPSAQRAVGSSKMVSTPADAVSTEDPVGEPTSVARFHAKQGTRTSAGGGLFARSAVTGKVGIHDLRVLPTAPYGEATLDLTWDVRALDTRSEPAASFAFSRHRVSAVQTPLAGVQPPSSVTTLGFDLSSENGHVTATAHDVPGSTRVREWLSTSLNSSGGRLSLVGGSPRRFTTKIPLGAPSGGATAPQPLNLSIQASQFGYAASAPLVAAPRVAEQAGAKTNTPGMHWDASEGILRFDPLPIQTLADGAGEGIATSYTKDPLSEGYLRIDPLTLRGSRGNKRFFTGGELRLSRADGEILFRSTLPGLVFDDSLEADQGFNLFAPLLNLVELHPQRSDWLHAFQARNTLDSGLLPELFIRFEPPGAQDALWTEDFHVAPRAVVSFAGLEPANTSVIPTPSTIWSLLIGLAALFLMVARGKRGRLSDHADNGLGC